MHRIVMLSPIHCGVSKPSRESTDVYRREVSPPKSINAEVNRVFRCLWACRRNSEVPARLATELPINVLQ